MSQPRPHKMGSRATHSKVTSSFKKNLISLLENINTLSKVTIKEDKHISERSWKKLITRVSSGGGHLKKMYNVYGLVYGS